MMMMMMLHGGSCIVNENFTASVRYDVYGFLMFRTRKYRKHQTGEGIGTFFFLFQSK